MVPSEPLLSWQSHFLPKRGHTLEEYEDACAVDGLAGRFAIADGASESSFAGAWAKIAAESFVATPGPWSRWLPPARLRWHNMFAGLDLPWYAEDPFKQGAFATLLGLALTPGGSGTLASWQAWAVGDCCLFQVRHNALLRAFPIRRSADFDSRPQLLGSRDSRP